MLLHGQEGGESGGGGEKEAVEELQAEARFMISKCDDHQSC